MTKGVWKWTAVGLVAAMATGCGVELEGDEGNLSFDYIESQWQGAPLSGDLAVGTQVDVEVTDARADGGDEALELTDAYSEDAQTLDVADLSSHQFQLEAHQEGPSEGTTINAEALDREGEEIGDSVSIRTAEVESVDLDSRCSEALYVTDSLAEFRYDMRDSLDDRLTGYGYYPVDVEPETGGEVDESTQVIQTLRVETGDEAGEYGLEPGEEVGGEAFGFELVEPAAITELDLQTDHEDADSTVAVGDDDITAIFGLDADGDNICGGAEGAVEVETSTPEVCEPTYSFFGSLHAVRVEGMEAGQCDIELSVADTDHAQNFTVEIE